MRVFLEFLIERVLLTHSSVIHGSIRDEDAVFFRNPVFRHRCFLG